MRHHPNTEVLIVAKKAQTSKTKSTRKPKKPMAVLKREGATLRFINCEVALPRTVIQQLDNGAFEGVKSWQPRPDSFDFNIIFTSEEHAKKAIGDLFCEPNTPINTALLDALSPSSNYEFDDPDMAGFADAIVNAED